MKLQLFNGFDKIVVLDAQENVTIFSRTEHPRETKAPICGHCTFLDGDIVAFYVSSRRMYIKNGKTVIPLTQDVAMQFARDDQMSILTIEKKGNLLLRLSVRCVYESFLFFNDPTMIGIEDFDFLLFVFNVFNSIERQAIFIDSKVGC